MKGLFGAIVLMASAKLLFAIQDVIIKEMSDGYAVHQIVVIRGLVAIPLMLLVLHFYGGLGLLKKCQTGFHLLRGLFMFIAFMCFYLALAQVSLLIVTALFFTAPFFISLLSVPLLGERVGIRRIVAVAVGFIGVLIVLRPETSGFSWAMLLPIIAAIFYAIGQLMVRMTKANDPVSIMTLYSNLVTVVLGCLMGLLVPWLAGSHYGELSAFPSNDPVMAFLVRDWRIPDSGDWILLIMTGVTTAFGYLMSSNAYRQAEASRIAGFEYVMVIWVVVLSYLVWGEIPDVYSILGISVIIASGLYVMAREQASQVYSK